MRLFATRDFFSLQNLQTARALSRDILYPRKYAWPPFPHREKKLYTEGIYRRLCRPAEAQNARISVNRFGVGVRLPSARSAASVFRASTWRVRFAVWNCKRGGAARNRARGARRRAQVPIFFFRRSLTACGLALPPDAFITWPTNQPIAFGFDLASATLSGCFNATV